MDSLFGDRRRFDFLLFFAVAMIMNIRESLLQNDFAQCLMQLQDIAVADVYPIIADATTLMDQTDPSLLEPSNLAKIYADAMDEIEHPERHQQQSTERVKSSHHIHFFNRKKKDKKSSSQKLK